MPQPMLGLLLKFTKSFYRFKTYIYFVNQNLYSAFMFITYAEFFVMIKLYNVITFFLIAYIALMAYWSRDLIIVYNNYFEYFSLIGISLIAIFILRYTIKLRDRKNCDDN